MTWHSDEWLEKEITVCAECLRASCWNGIFMCDKARQTGTGLIIKTRRELIKLGLEDPSYLKTDKELCDELEELQAILDNTNKQIDK